jgi:hypothetical protein
MANGQVFFEGASGHYVWDPSSSAPPRSAEPTPTDERTVWMSNGGSRFVVENEDEKKTLTLELWDAPSLAKVKALPGVWKDAQTRAHVSLDGQRFLLDAVFHREPSFELTENEISVYDLAAGALVHTTKLTLRTERYELWPVLSSRGTYFALDHPELPYEIRNSKSGELTLRTDRGTVYGFRGELVDDDRAIVEEGKGRFQIVDLTTTRLLKVIDFKLKPGVDTIGTPVLSPDRKRAALGMKRGGLPEIAVVTLDDGSFTAHPVPPEICDRFCDVSWTSDDALVGHSDTAKHRGERVKISIDGTVTTGAIDVPTRVAAGFAVYLVEEPSDTDKTDAAAHASSYVLTPNGARVDLPGRYRTPETHTSAFGENAMIWTLASIVVVSKDGSVSELGWFKK